MAEIGTYNTLEIVKEVEFGAYLDGEELGEILIPTRYIPENSQLGDEIEVFIYLDSEDRIIATTEKPFATINEFAYLEVAAITSVGAFLNWGLSKDLLVPFREQKVTMEAGRKYIVYIYFDVESKRIVASSKIDKFIDNLPVEYEEGQAVELMIVNETDLGYKAIIEDAHWGVLYKNEVFKPLKNGERVFAYVQKIREDDKIDLSLYKPGYEKIDDFSVTLEQYLKDQGGSISITDKSPSELISKTFGVSKKTFKKAVGQLYKKRQISITEKGIELL